MPAGPRLARLPSDEPMMVRSRRKDAPMSARLAARSGRFGLRHRRRTASPWRSRAAARSLSQGRQLRLRHALPRSQPPTVNQGSTLLAFTSRWTCSGSRGTPRSEWCARARVSWPSCARVHNPMFRASRVRSVRSEVESCERRHGLRRQRQLHNRHDRPEPQCRDHHEGSGSG
jgi:hypothetical protein